MSSPIAERIVEVPRLYAQGDKSTACLLKDAGYLDHPGDISVDDIEDSLRHHPTLTGLWMARGSDQRFAGGWGLERAAPDHYRVVHFGHGGALHLNDPIRACAEFIARYVRVIGEAMARRG